MRWWQQGVWIALTGFVTLAAGGCGYAISENIRRQADTTVPFAAVRRTPEAYKGHVVIFGGEILQTRIVQKGSLLEVLHRPLNRYERPLHTDRTAGRFMVRCKTYLDPAVYTKGRRVTVAGRVLGTHSGRVGEIEYTYPLLSCLELHLWPQPAVVPQPYPPYVWWYWDPWYWPSPWYWRPYYYPVWSPWDPAR